MNGKALSARQAKALILKILKEGTVIFSDHCQKELKNDNLTTVDAVNVLRCGSIEEKMIEFVGDSWRYRVHTERMCAVAAFRSESNLVVVTAWRKKGSK